MPLKPKNPLTPSELPPLKDELSGPWGRINPEPQAVLVLRLCRKTSASNEETYSYPYRVLSSWHWRRRAIEEELIIEAGADLITVKGRGLDRIVEALNCGMLAILSESSCGIPSKEDHQIWVLMITISENHI